MKAKLIAVGERAPGWVAEGFGEYQKRLSHWLPLDLVEVEPGVRGKGRDTQRAMTDEGGRVLAALPKSAHVVALDGRGRMYSGISFQTQMRSHIQIAATMMSSGNSHLPTASSRWLRMRSLSTGASKLVKIAYQ